MCKTNVWLYVYHSIFISRSRGNDLSNKNHVKTFKVGLQPGSGVKSGQVRLAMVAFWDRTITDYDISSIYKSGRHYS
jgi:hypothetical protein